MNTLERLNNFVDALSQVTKMKEKEDICKTHDDADLRKILKYTYNKMDTFGITSKVVKTKGPELVKNPMNMVHPYSEIYDLLDDLVSRKITGNLAIVHVYLFAQNCGYEDLFYHIIDRNLKNGVATSMLNKMYDNLVPKFDVALAASYNKMTGKTRPNFDEDEWFFLRKLDGCRCVAIVKDGKVRFWSRGEKEFLTLDKVRVELEEVLASLRITDIVLDGEICIVDEEGNEDFQSIMKVIKKKDHTIENPRYKIFDIVNVDEFYAKFSEDDYSVRNDRIGSLFEEDRDYLDWVQPLGIVESDEHLEKEMDNAEKLGWEGLMLRKGPYEGKRSNNLVKVKRFNEAEYELIDLDLGMIQYTKYVTEDGTEYIDPADIPMDTITITKEHSGHRSKNVRTKKVRVPYEQITGEAEMVRSAFFIHKGTRVGVGSGWSIKDRLYYKEHPEELIGQIATISYFEESQNQDGSYSLRFPVIKALHGSKRDV